MAGVPEGVDPPAGRPGWRTPLGTIETVEQGIALLGLVVLTAAIVWGVLSRYVVTTPAAWVEEVSSIAFAWLIFVGAAEVHRRRQQISVDIVTSLLPPAMRSALAVLVEVGVLGFCLFAAFLGAEQALASWDSYTSILRLPLWINFLGLTVGFLLMAYRSIRYLLGLYRLRAAR